MNIIEVLGATLILAFLNGVCYRMGGSDNYSRFFRPLGIGLITMLVLALWSYLTIPHIKLTHWIGIITSAGASAGLSTTYFKKKNTDAHLINWILVGIAFSIALVPYAYVTDQWVGLIVRSIFLIPAIALWSELIGWDVLEEFGRGFWHVISICLIFIPYFISLLIG